MTEHKRPIPSTADFWRSLGHNVIPVRHGKPIEDWKRWQYEQIPKSQHEVWKYNHSFDSGMMVMLGKSWVNSQYLWVAIPIVTTTNQQCIERNCQKKIETDSNYCRYCGTKQKYDDHRIKERTVLNEMPDPNDEVTKTFVAIYSLIHGFDGPPLSAEKVFMIWWCCGKKNYLYLYGYCKQPFPDLKLKDFDVKTSGIVYCPPMITINEMSRDGSKKRTYSDMMYADYHGAIIPFHEFVGQNERVFELINDLVEKNIRDRPILVSGTKKTTTQPFALLEDWEEANRLVGGGSIDTKKITGSYLASNVRDYARIHQGKIMTPRSFSNERKRLPVERLISEYYEHSLENRLQLRPHLLGWLKEKMEERLDSCGYAMRYGKEYNQENIVATKYLLKMIDRSFTITEQNLVAIRDAWKVLLLDDFHLEWLKEYLLYETKSESERLARFDTTARSSG